MIWVALCILGFCLMLAFSFFPGYQEIKRRRDDKKLYINERFRRDPRYFSKSFLSLLKAKGVDIGSIAGEVQIQLSKPEKIACLDGQLAAAASGSLDVVGIFREPVRVPAGTRFAKEVVFVGDATLEEGVQVRAAAGLGSVRLGANAACGRWIDAEGLLEAGPGCDLGHSASAGGQVLVGQGCTFERLYAPRIVFGAPGQAQPADFRPGRLLPPRYDEIDRDIEGVAAGELVCSHIVTKKRSFRIGENSCVSGSVKAYGDLEIESGACVLGNVFCEGRVKVGPRAHIFGDVFCNASAEIGEGATVGVCGRVRSLIVRDALAVAPGCIVYGFVSAEGAGRAR